MKLYNLSVDLSFGYYMYIRWTVLTTRTPAVTMECLATPPSRCSATESLQITVGPGKQVRFYLFYFVYVMRVLPADCISNVPFPKFDEMVEAL